MTDYKALIGEGRARKRSAYVQGTATGDLLVRLADAVEALVAENERLEAENAKGGTIVKRAADMALRTPFSLQQATEALTFTTDVWSQFEAAKAERDALQAQLDAMTIERPYVRFPGIVRERLVGPWAEVPE